MRAKPGKAHVIVLGNEKGGSGKSTTAMHITVGLLVRGFFVGTIDVDARQGSLSRYLENRRAYAAANNLELLEPRHHVVPPSNEDSVAARQAEETQRFLQSLEDLSAHNDFVVVDCPGSDCHLSRLAHSYADTLITPLNDSFVDLDVLARIDWETNRVIRLSHYSELVWESKKIRAQRDQGSIDWVVMRNRMSHLDAHNKRRVHDALVQLEKRLGFRTTAGLGERVIYRELFLQGLTLLDFKGTGIEREMTMSHVAARQELRHLIDSLQLPALQAEAAE
ncbi:MAG: ATPase [Alphaproteobacteria bacterium]|nr:MAG: ATPase [Alphaproteobacteria bacterium]